MPLFLSCDRTKIVSEYDMLCDDSHIWHALVVFCMEKSTYVFLMLFFFLTFSLGLRLRPPDKTAIEELFFLFLIQNICCVYSKEPSQ